MKGWYRINDRARWHFFAPWEANELVLKPACNRDIFLKRSEGLRLRSRVDLPPVAEGQLCRGCAASPEVREVA